VFDKRSLISFAFVVSFLALFFLVSDVYAVDGSPDAGKVVINEVLYKGTCGGNSSSANDEFVELYVNTGIDMCGWTIADGNVTDGDTDGGGGFVYTFNSSDGCQFDPGDYIVVWIGKPFTMTQASNAALQVHLGKRPKLNNSGDDVWLFDGGGKLVDYMAYGSDNAINDQHNLPPGFWNGNAPTVSEQGQSLSLTPNGVDTSDGNDWEPTTSGGAPGPITVDTDDLVCNGHDRVSSAGVNNNPPPTPTPTPTVLPTPTSAPVVPLNVPEPSTFFLSIFGGMLLWRYAREVGSR